jgi:hypothetical protein
MAHLWLHESGRSVVEIKMDQQRSTRFRVQAPAIATIRNREILAFTKDISTRAVYLRMVGEPEKPSIGEPLDFFITIPPSLSYPKLCCIKGWGRTIRIDDLGGDETGLAVEILAYDIASELVH